MDQGKNASQKVLRKRDIGILCIMAISIYISIDTVGLSYRLDPAWFIEHSKPPVKNYHEVPILITDLNGDSSNEIISISNDFVLQVFSAESEGEGIYTPTELASTRLSKVNIRAGNTPVALAAGYVKPYDPDKERSKVIVVMTQDLTVTCYSQKLELLWQKGIQHNSHHMDFVSEHYKVVESSIFVTALNLQNTIGGTIIVGVSLGLIEDGSLAAQKEAAHGGLDMKEDGKKEHPEMKDRTSLEHFSVYALDASTGHIIWKHDGTEMKHEQYTRSLPQHAYTLDTFDLSHIAPSLTSYTNNNDWSQFKSSLVAELPHDWHRREDTKMRLAHFVRRHLGSSQTRSLSADKSNKPKRSAGKLLSGESGRFSGIETPPLSISASLPHDASEHTDHPNVLVMHTRQGLEAISLRAGIPVTSFALNKGQTYADIDGDGVVDSILVLENEHDVEVHKSAFSVDGELQNCMMMVLSGLPPKGQLFNGTVCTHRRTLQDPLARPQSSKPPPISSASPLILREFDDITMTEAKMKSVVISINTGITTCYEGNGDYKWQVKGGPTWASDYQFSTLIHFDVDASRAAELGSHDNTDSFVFIAGDKEISLNHRDGGYVLASAILPATPIARPLIGDFNNDGNTDVIVVTEDAILGYRLEVTPSSQAMLIAVLCLSVLVVLVFLANLKVDTIQTRSGKKRVYSILRSTDDFHID